MARWAGVGAAIGMLLGCARTKTIVLNPESTNTFERCKVVCDAQSMGPPKVSVETEDSFRCYCTWPVPPGT